MRFLLCLLAMLAPTPALAQAFGVTNDMRLEDFPGAEMFEDRPNVGWITPPQPNPAFPKYVGMFDADGKICAVSAQIWRYLEQVRGEIGGDPPPELTLAQKEKFFNNLLSALTERYGVPDDSELDYWQFYNPTSDIVLLSLEQYEFDKIDLVYWFISQEECEASFVSPLDTSGL